MASSFIQSIKKMSMVGYFTIVCTFLVLQARCNTVESSQRQGSPLTLVESQPNSFWRRLLEENGTIIKQESKEVKIKTESEISQGEDNGIPGDLSKINSDVVFTTEKEKLKANGSLPKELGTHKAEADAEVSDKTKNSFKSESTSNVTTIESHKDENSKMVKNPNKINEVKGIPKVTALENVEIQKVEKGDSKPRNESSIEISAEKGDGNVQSEVKNESRLEKKVLGEVGLEERNQSNSDEKVIEKDGFGERNEARLVEKAEQKFDSIYGDIDKTNKTRASGIVKVEEKVQKQSVNEKQSVEDGISPPEKIIQMVENESNMLEKVEFVPQIKEVNSSTTKVENGKVDADGNGDDNNDSESDGENVLRQRSDEEQEEEDGAKTFMLNDKEGHANDREQMTEEEAQEDIEQKLQELKREKGLEPNRQTNTEANPGDGDEDDIYDIMQEIVELPSTLQETAGKVAEHLRPDMQKWSETSKVYFDRANHQITETVSPLVGEQYAPSIAACISYGLLVLPLGVVIVLFDHIRALLSLQKILLVVNIYLAAYFATLWLMSYVVGLEPMAFFFANNMSSYLSLQLLQALGYLLYLTMQTINFISSWKFDTSLGKTISSLQWIAAVLVGLHYYVVAFHPAVSMKPPRINWKIYAVYSVTFSILCLFPKIKWTKKQYISNTSVNKKC